MQLLRGIGFHKVSTCKAKQAVELAFSFVFTYTYYANTALVPELAEKWTTMTGDKYKPPEEVVTQE